MGGSGTRVEDGEDETDETDLERVRDDIAAVFAS
jgi:hypothetical protein